jgi:sugar/nucleoside kinase (ribokinase family)
MFVPSIGARSRGPRPRPGPLLVVGAATRDIDPGEARGWRLGGGVTYGSLAAARLGVRVHAVIGLDREALDAPELGLLQAAGVELELVPLRRGPVFEIRHGPQRRVLVARQPSDPVTPTAVPDSWRAAPAVLLAPVAGELGDEWRDFPSPEAIVGLAWQGLYRRLRAGRPIEHTPLRPAALSARADVAAVSAEDAVAGGASLADLLPRVGQQLAVTRGALGALHFQRVAEGGALGSSFHVRTVPPVAPSVRTEATGTGDVFLAAWMAALLAHPGAMPGAMAWPPLAVAAATASVAAEAPGLDGLPDLSAVCRRLLRQPVGDDHEG